MNKKILGIGNAIVDVFVRVDEKFLEENNITKNRKWDLNDLVVHLRSTGKKIKRLDGYFTDDVLDLRYFINE